MDIRVVVDIPAAMDIVVDIPVAMDIPMVHRQFAPVDMLETRGENPPGEIEMVASAGD
jgi:hypothetical protein